MHWRGFEPLTARFVAGYSIQLSYQCKDSARQYSLSRRLRSRTNDPPFFLGNLRKNLRKTIV